MTAQNEGPRWLPVGQLMARVDFPFAAWPFSPWAPCRPFNARTEKPQWIAANDATYTPPKDAA